MLLSTISFSLYYYHKKINPFTTIKPLGGLPTRRSFSTTPEVIAQPLKSKDYEAYIAKSLQELSTLPNVKPFETVSPYYPYEHLEGRLKGKPNKRLAVDVAVKFKNIPTYLGDPNLLEDANTKKVVMFELKTLEPKSKRSQT